MPPYVLSIIVDGPGTDPNHRSHWAFAIHEPDSGIGNLLQVQLIDLATLRYLFEERKGVPLHSRVSEGSFQVATLTQAQAKQAAKIICDEDAPNNNKDRCQDWVLHAIVSLEAEELVPPGSSDWIESLVGKSADEVAQSAGQIWTKTADTA